MLNQREAQGLRRADILLAGGRATEARIQVRALLCVAERVRVREAGRERDAALAAAQLCLFDAWPDESFECPAHGRLRYRVCIARQIHTDQERGGGDDDRPWALRRHDGKRGRAATYVSCDASCVLGRRIRDHFGDGCAAQVRTGTKE